MATAKDRCGPQRDSVYADCSGEIANTGLGGSAPDASLTATPTYGRLLTTWFDRSGYITRNGQPDGTTVGILRTGNDQYRYGQVGANTLRSDVYRQFDASIFKNFACRTGRIFRSTRSFDLSNTPSFSVPDATLDATAGGSITDSSVPSRDIQIALKYNF